MLVRLNVVVAKIQVFQNLIFASITPVWLLIQLPRNTNKLFVIYNSLDYMAQVAVRRRLQDVIDGGRSLLPIALRNCGQYVASVARLTSR